MYEYLKACFFFGKLINHYYENNVKDVRVNCFCASLLRTQVVSQYHDMIHRHNII